MILSTIYVWLIVVGFTVVITALFWLTSRETIIFVVLPIYLLNIFVPIAAAISGFKASNGTGSFYVGLVLSVILSAFFVYFDSNGFKIFRIELLNLFAILSPIIFFLIAFCIRQAQLFFKASGNSLAVYCMTMIAIILTTIGFYLIIAFLSTTIYSIIPESLFFSRPPNDITTVYIRNGESLLRNENGSLFTGEIKSYNKRLSIDFFTKKMSGTAYYIEGLLFGESGDTIPPGHFSRSYGSYAVTEKWCGYNLNTDYVFLLHKNYESIVKEVLPKENLIYYKEYTENKDCNYEKLKIELIYKFPDRLEKKEVYFYKNGVIYEIDTEMITNSDRRNTQWSKIFFDGLGYDSDTVWNHDDFIQSRFKGLDYIRTMAEDIKTH